MTEVIIGLLMTAGLICVTVAIIWRQEGKKAALLAIGAVIGGVWYIGAAAFVATGVTKIIMP